MFWRRIKLLWMNHKVWFVGGVVMLILVILSIWGLANLESFFQQQIVFTLPWEIVQMVGYSVLGDWAYVHGAAIIFIDELDAIGQSRKFSAFGSQESDNTLNQLLVNMDGLANEEGGNVIIIGATNADENKLDPALVRPGRFDRKIQIT